MNLTDKQKEYLIQYFKNPPKAFFNILENIEGDFSKTDFDIFITNYINTSKELGIPITETTLLIAWASHLKSINYNTKEFTLITLIKETLNKLNVPTSRKGYPVFIDMVLYVYDTDEQIEITNIYQIFAKKYNCTPSSIERNLRTLLNHAKENIETYNISNEATEYIIRSKDSFTLKNFLYTFKDYIKELTKKPKTNNQNQIDNSPQIQKTEELVEKILTQELFIQKNDLAFNDLKNLILTIIEIGPEKACSMSYIKILNTYTNSKSEKTATSIAISARINRALDKTINFINTYNLKNDPINYIFDIKHAYKAKQFAFAIAEYIIEIKLQKPLTKQLTQ